MIALTHENFDEQVIRNHQLALVVFSADWCGSCKMLSPELQELNRLHKGQALIARVDVDHDPELAKQYQINHIPALLFFREGTVVDRHTGAIPLAVLSEKLLQATQLFALQ